MQLFTDAYLNRLIDRSEEWLSMELRCLRFRKSLAIVAGTSDYILPVGTIGIENVCWLGEDIDNDEQSDFREDGNYRPPSSAVEATRPWFYSMAGQGMRNIQFYPKPSHSIAADDTKLVGASGMKQIVAIQVIRIAQVNGSETRLPDYLLRHIIKYRAMSEAYAREGKTLNIKASQYFMKRFEFFLGEYKKIINKIPQAVQLELGDPSRPQALGDGRKIPRPQLPTTGPWSI